MRGTTAQRGYAAGWATTRAAVLTRDGHTCMWCGAFATTVDHVVPLARGGARLDPLNLVAACATCNSSRGGRTRRKRTT